MYISRILRLAAFLAMVPGLAAQDSPASASSPGYFLSAFVDQGAGATQSSQYRLSTSIGPIAGESSSAQHRLVAGGIPGLHQAVGGQPLLSAALTRYAPLGGGSSIELAGINLDLGNIQSLKVGGQTVSTVQSRSPSRLRFVLPAQPEPGWQEIELQTSAGDTQLAQGIGVLPLLEETPGAAPEQAFGITFRGTQGDQVVWALGVAPAAAPIPIGSFQYGLAINPSVLLIVPGFTILGADGSFVLPIPASSYPLGNIYVQALFDSSNPGYSPGAFSNVLRL